MLSEEIVVAALARCAEYGGSYPTARSVVYRRVAVRCGQLLALAAEWNPELAAVSEPTTVALDGSVPTVDLTALSATPLALLGLSVATAATSPYVAGQAVSLVPASDLEADIAPRVVVEQGGRTLRAVDADLVGVGLLVRYVPTPDPLDEAAEADPEDVGLPPLAHELLVVDLARWCMTKALGTEPAVAQAAVQSLVAEEADLLGLYQRQVQTFTPMVSDRFARPVRLPDTLSTPRT